MAGPPTKIGKYDILREIGRGGMGKVYGAVDPTIGRMVAIKQVTAVVSDDPDLLKRFYREAQSTGKLQHPNIVTLHDLGEQDGIPYLVMEYLEGDSLEKIIQERRPYTVAEKLNIILQVCEGLGYAHQRQIIHRDIKPGNIVVLNDGGVKIVDFGIAQFGNERYTRTGQVVGSLYYMSPEQIQDADIDLRSDIYSTGIVLYEFLTGTVPFRGKDPASTLAKILHDTPPSLAGSIDVYTSDLDAVIRRALAKDRNTRYTSMEDFAFDLRTLQEKLSLDLIANFQRGAESLIGAKQWDKAREQLRQILKLDKQHRRANELLREVQAQIHRQQVGEQVRQFRAKADEALGLRNWDEALMQLDRAIKIDGSNSELIRFRESVQRSSTMLTDALRRAESAHNAGDLDAAKQAVDDALSIDPYNTTAKALSAILSKELSERAKRQKVEESVAAARKEITLRHFNPALELLRAAEAIDASSVEVQQLIRSALAGIEQERRRAVLEKACAEIEDLLNRDQYGAACDRADEALRIFPQDLGLLKLKGFAERQKEAWQRRQFLEAQISTARQLADAEEFSRAQRILNEALERYPDDPGAMSLLAIVTEGLARQEAQRREAERQAAEKRRYIRMQLDSAATLQQAGQTADALKIVREALTRHPENQELKQRASVLEEALAQEEAARKRAEEQQRLKQAEIEKTIADSWQLLSTKQTGEAVTLLGEALRRHPDSTDLKSQLEFAQRRLAVAKAERERAEQEARRRSAEIQKEVTAAQQLLENRQTDQAIRALEQVLGRYADSEELKSLLQAAYRRQTAERAERQRIELEAREKQAEIVKEIAAARDLLEAKQTSESVAKLEQALSRHPGSEELKHHLAFAQQRLAAEEAARKKAQDEERRRRAWVDAEITVTRQWLNEKQADRAVMKLTQALNLYPENTDLKAQLDFAKQRVAQELAEREQSEREAQRKREEINQEIRRGVELLDAGTTKAAIESFERAILRFPDNQDLRAQLDFARSRFAEEEAERQRVAEEKRRRQAEIDRALLSARQFLESEQTARAVSALELAFQRYPDSGELKSELDRARKKLAAEEAERQRIDRENRRKQEEVKNEIRTATQLLDAGQTVQAIQSLEGALRRIPDSEELKLQLKRAKDQLAKEEAERQRIAEEKRRRQAEIDRALLSAQQLLGSGQTARAVSGLEVVFHQYPDSGELKSQLEAARKKLAAEEAERQRIDQENRQKREEVKKEIGSATQLMSAGQTVQAIESLEKALRRVPDGEELKIQLQRAKDRLAKEEAERQRIAEEKRRRQAEIDRALLSAQQLLGSGQTARALSALELAFQQYPEGGELKSQLEAARKKLAAEEAERQRIDQENRRKQEEVRKEIGSATQLMHAGQTVQAIESLEKALRRIPDRDELRVELKRAKDRLAEEEAARRRAEEEKQRREAEIASVLAAARKLLEAKQTTRAAADLEAAARKYPDDDGVRALLSAANAMLAQERAAQEKAAREAEERRQKIVAEVDNAQRLLKANHTSQALAALDGALRRFPESDDLRSQLAAAKEQQAREIAEREKAEKRQAQLRAEIAKAQSLLDSGEPDKALSAAEAALRIFGKESQLQQLVDNAKAAVKLRKAEEKKRAAEREQAEERKRLRDRDLADLQKLADSVATTKRPALDKLLRKAGEIAARYRNDAAFQQSFRATRAAVESAQMESQPAPPSEAPQATKFFTTDKIEAAAPVSAPVRETPAPPVAPASSVLPLWRNKWVAIGAVTVLIVAGVVIKLILPSKPPVVSTYVVSIDSQPAGATIQVGNQTCTTPNCHLSLPAGEYRLQAQLNGYQPLSQSVTVDAQRPNAPVNLLFVAIPPPETAGYLVIKAGLAGADVLINGNKRSQTGVGGTLRLSLEPGSYSVEVEKKGYTTAKSSGVQIRKGQDTALELSLPPLPTVAELVITGAVPNAQVFNDGREVGRTDGSGAFRQSVEPGTHEILLAEDGRRSNAVRESFVAGRAKDLEGRFFVIPPKPMSVVVINHLPSGAMVKVEGATYGADQSGNVRFDLAVGDHTLEISADGFRPKQIQRSFGAGQLSLDGSLERLDLEGPEWAKVESSNDMAALQGFLNAFPKGKNAQQAQSKLERLIAFNASEKELNAFYERFPNTSAGLAARKRAAAMDADHRRQQDEADLRSVIRRYEQAFEKRDVNALLVIWPGMGSKRFNAYRDSFAFAKSYQVQMQVESINISPDGQTATASGVLSSTFIAKENANQPKPQRDRAVFDLKKSNGIWVISDMR